MTQNIDSTAQYYANLISQAHDSRKSIMSGTKEMVENFIHRELGQHWVISNFKDNYIVVSMTDGNEPMFGHDFYLSFGKRFLSDEIQFKANIGTLGEFEVDMCDESSIAQLYIGFAKFLEKSHIIKSSLLAMNKRCRELMIEIEDYREKIESIEKEGK